MSHLDVEGAEGQLDSESELAMIKEGIQYVADYYGEDVSGDEIDEYLAKMAGDDGAIDADELAWIMGELLFVTEHLGDFMVGAGIITSADEDGSGTVSEDEFVDCLTEFYEDVVMIGGYDGV